MSSHPPKFDEKRFLIALYKISRKGNLIVDKDSIHEDCFKPYGNITTAIPELWINRKKVPASAGEKIMGVDIAEKVVVISSYAPVWCEIAHNRGFIIPKPNYGKMTYIFTEYGLNKAAYYHKLDSMNCITRFIYTYRSPFYKILMLILTAIAAICGLIQVYSK